jgi:hypothetical protein
MINQKRHELVSAMITRERNRQEALRVAGRFAFTLDDPKLSESCAVLCIVEEVGETARNILSRLGLVQDGEPKDEMLLGELVHVAALASAMAERYV